MGLYVCYCLTMYNFIIIRSLRTSEIVLLSVSHNNKNRWLVFRLKPSSRRFLRKMSPVRSSAEVQAEKKTSSGPLRVNSGGQREDVEGQECGKANELKGVR